ncbi:hypothetical protein [Mucilaginibacter endophyticus]|nr:hypothetical protein [Mucilaginibacter endophyticus]
MINGSTYTVLSEKPDEAIIRINGEKLDIYSTDGHIAKPFDFLYFFKKI